MLSALLAAGIPLSVSIALFALALSISSYAGSLIYRSRRGQGLTDLQSKAVDAQEVLLTAANAEIANLKAVCNSQQEQIEQLREQVDVLKELVTQSAKVDIVRTEIADGFAGVNRKLDRLSKV